MKINIKFFKGDKIALIFILLSSFFCLQTSFANDKIQQVSRYARERFLAILTPKIGTHLTRLVFFRDLPALQAELHSAQPNFPLDDSTPA